MLFRDGRRVGYNTDVSGFAGAFARGLPGVDHESVVQFGAGGAGAATAYSLLMGRDSKPRDRRPAAGRRARAGKSLTRSWCRIGTSSLSGLTTQAKPLADADGFVNATPFGMYIHPGRPIDVWVFCAQIRGSRMSCIGRCGRTHDRRPGSGARYSRRRWEDARAGGRQPPSHHRRRARRRAHAGAPLPPDRVRPSRGSMTAFPIRPRHVRYRESTRQMGRRARQAGRSISRRSARGSMRSGAR